MALYRPVPPCTALNRSVPPCAAGPCVSSLIFMVCAAHSRLIVVSYKPVNGYFLGSVALFMAASVAIGAWASRRDRKLAPRLESVRQTRFVTTGSATPIPAPLLHIGTWKRLGQLWRRRVEREHLLISTFTADFLAIEDITHLQRGLMAVTHVWVILGVVTITLGTDATETLDQPVELLPSRNLFGYAFLAIFLALPLTLALPPLVRRLQLFHSGLVHQLV